MKKITFLLAAVFAVMFVNGQTILFQEGFGKANTDKEADANGNITGTTDIASKLDEYTDNTGWSGVKVYEGKGELKLGTSSVMGSLTTPAINLTSSFTVSLDIRSWNNTGGVADPGSSIQILVDGAVKETISYTTAMATYTTGTITAASSSSKIAFSALVAKNRFFIDNIIVKTAVNSNVVNTKSDSFKFYLSGKSLVSNLVTNGTPVEIFNMVGEKVISTEYNGGIAVGHLNKGVYIVRTDKGTQKVTL